MNILDSVISAISPITAERRALARARIKVLTRRSYDGAGKGRILQGWQSSMAGPNMVIEGALPMLRARSRDMLRNMPTARKAVEDYLSYTIGKGIRPQPKTSDDQLNNEIEAVWREWVEVADADGCGTYYGLQAAVFRSIFEGGDAIIRLRPRRPSDGLPVPLQLDALEGDYIDEGYNEDRANGVRIRMGVEIGPRGNVQAYHVFREHPGERHGMRGAAARVRVPVEQAMHVFYRERLKQRRGVPWLAASMMKARQLDDYEISELERKKIEAAVAAVVLGPSADIGEAPGSAALAPVMMDSDDNPIEKIAPGMIAYANGAGSIEFNKPAPASGYAEYKTAQMQTIAAGALMPYEIMSGDLSRANYSSLRAGILTWRKIVERLQQHVVIDMFCKPTYRRFIDMAAGTGRLPRFKRRPELARELYHAEWTAPRFPAVDPLKEAQADLIETRAGTKSLTRVAKERGDDLADLLEEIRTERQMAKSMGIILDSDPAKVSRSGVMQSMPPDADAPATPEDPEGEEEGSEDD